MAENNLIERKNVVPGWLKLAFQPEPYLGDIEEAYQHTTQPEDARQVRLIAGIYLVAVVVYVFILLLPVILAGSAAGGGAMGLQTTARFVAVVACLAIILGVGRLHEPRQLQLATLVWALVVVAAELVVRLTWLEDFYYQASLDVVLIMAIYMAVPNKFIYRLAPAWLLTLGKLLLFVIFRDSIPLVPLLSSILALLLANVMGLLISKWLYTYRRLGYKAQYNERLAAQEVERLETTDALTGALNRRRFLEILNREYQRYQRTSHGFSLLFIDLDHFKSINDIYGHTAGDAVLMQFVEKIQTHIRKIDAFARLGGEEFALLLPETGIDKALEAAERLRAICETMTANTEAGELVFTVSFGATEVQQQDESIDVLLSRAEQALYKAKENGRNRVEHS